MPLPNFLKNIFSGGAKELADSVKGIIDESKFSAEEKAELDAKIESATFEHVEKMQGLAMQETEAFLKDTQSARDSNVKIQESDKAGWLAKNVAYVIDLFLAALWGTITIILFLKVFKIAAQDVDMISLMALHGTVTAVFMTVVNFHRGSSVGSKANGDAMRKMLEK